MRTINQNNNIFREKQSWFIQQYFETDSKPFESVKIW